MRLRRNSGFQLGEAPLEEALAWTKRFPNPSIDGGAGEIEVRPFFELEDFGDSAGARKAREIGLQK